MDIDIIRDQKLGAGAGIRSNKVCLCVVVVVLLHYERTSQLLLEEKSIVDLYIIPEPITVIQARAAEAHRSRAGNEGHCSRSFLNLNLYPLMQLSEQIEGKRNESFCLNGCHIFAQKYKWYNQKISHEEEK